ncbi:MAG: hypothetical protein WHS82_08310, partial [Candidatus Methanosuratincola sp.]
MPLHGMDGQPSPARPFVVILLGEGSQVVGVGEGLRRHVDQPRLRRDFPVGGEATGERAVAQPVAVDGVGKLPALCVVLPVRFAVGEGGAVAGFILVLQRIKPHIRIAMVVQRIAWL